MRGVAVALAVVVLAVGTACGGGGNSKSGEANRTITPEAQKHAEAINLKLTDFPNGWRASTPTTNEAEKAKTLKCFGLDYSKLTLIGAASSRDFAKGNNATASSDAKITKTEEQAKDGLQRVAEALAGPAARDCFRKEIGSTPGYKVGEIDVGELKYPSPPNVDDARAWEVVIPTEVTSGPEKGFSLPGYVDTVVLRKGNIVAHVDTSGVLSPLDEALRAHLVRTVAERISASA
jgi:hypothetical protein